jgi:DNA replication ATP-dependent helicase Dna2
MLFLNLVSPSDKQIMKSIDRESAVYLYDRLLSTHRQQLGYREKIIQFRTLLEHLFKQLTQDEKEMIQDLKGRMQYIQNRYDPPGTLADELHEFRIFANRVVHQLEVEIGPKEYLTCLKVMAEGVHAFSTVAIPDDLTVLFSDAEDLQFSRSPQQKKKLIQYIQATVLDIGPIRSGANSREPDQLLCSLYCDTHEYGPITIVLRDLRKRFFGAHISQMSSILWRFATLDVYNLEQAKADQDVFLSTPNTLLVLEPDYLIQATDIARCFIHDGANPMLDIIHRFIESEPSTQMVKGALINYLLDEMMVDADRDFDQLYEEALRVYALDVLGLMYRKHGWDEELLASLRTEVAQHLPQLRAFVEATQNLEVFIEPTYNSVKYGLQGRLDLMLQEPGRPDKKDIIELKSGKSPSPYLNKGVKSEHEAQTHCYHLLLKSTYPSRVGNNAIFYSGIRADEPALRHVATNVQDAQEIMMMRNHLVWHDFQLAADNFEVLRQLVQGHTGSLPSWKNTDAALAINIFKHAPKLEIAFFRAYVAFITREKIIAKTGSDVDETDHGYAGLWQDSLDEKLQNYRILYGLELEENASDFRQFHLGFRRATALSRQVANFREGDIAVLYPVEKDGSLAPLSHQILKCSIKELSPDRVRISLRNKLVNPSYLRSHPHWVLEHDYLENSVTGLYQSLFKFLQSTEQHKKQVMLGQTAPEFGPTPGIEDPELSTAQNTLLNRALSAKDYFLLQGPPGTGKTSIVLRAMIRHLYADPWEQVLLMAYTNRAVDEICVQLEKESIPYLRLGFANADTFHVLSRILKEKSLKQTFEELSGIRVIVSTVSSYLSNFNKLRNRNFTTAIIDEASQLLDPYLCGMVEHARRFIMIGDEKQLPAVVTQNPARSVVQDPLLLQAGFHDLRHSLFERLLNRCRDQGWYEAYGMLSTHGRMHQEVAAFVNLEYYEQGLEVASERQRQPGFIFTRPVSDPLYPLMARHRLLYLSTPSLHYSKTHPLEAELIARMVHIIAAQFPDGIRPETLGIITPYRAQIAEITQRLPAEYQSLILVDTVERFQGSQREIILISMSVNHLAQLRHLQSPTLDGRVDRKLNVALTRARQHVYLLGCDEILSKNYHYNRLIAWAKQHKAYAQVADLADNI